MAATGRDDLFVMVEVKKAIKTIKAINPGVPQPVTSGTRKLARATLDLIATFAATKFLTRREEFLFAAECVTGARIGELAGAQVGHGAFANHYALLRWSGEHTIHERGRQEDEMETTAGRRGGRQLLRTRERDVEDGRAENHVRRVQDEG